MLGCIATGALKTRLEEFILVKRGGHFCEIKVDFLWPPHEGPKNRIEVEFFSAFFPTLTKWSVILVKDQDVVVEITPHPAQQVQRPLNALVDESLFRPIVVSTMVRMRRPSFRYAWLMLLNVRPVDLALRCTDNVQWLSPIPDLV